MRWGLHEALFRAGRVVSLRIRDDWTVRCHPASVGAFLVQRDTPELSRELDAFVASCSPGMVLLDAGAHFGIFTLAALRYGGERARVIAIDPSPDAMHLLDANVRLANGGPQVERLQAAVTRTRAEFRMVDTGAAAFHMMVPAGSRRDAVAAPGLPIDEIAAARGVRITHLKIDVEGGEADALAGARDVLVRDRPLLFLELHGWMLRRAGRDPAEILAFLRGCGYDEYEIDGREVAADAAAAADMARILCRPSANAGAA